MHSVYTKVVFFFAFIFCALSGSAQVSVTATAGTTGPSSYTTLKAAFDAINAGTHKGAITISISGNTTETAIASLLASSGTSSYTSVLIKPAAGTTPVITGSGAVTIKLMGADNVTIDGSNTAGGSTRDLSLINSGASGVVVQFASASAGDGADNNTLKNCILRGTATSTVGTFLSGSGTTLGGEGEAPNSNNTVANNLFTTAQNGFYIRGNPTTLDANWLIENNDIGSTTLAEKMTYRGLLIGNAQNYIIRGNRIAGVVSSTSSTSTTTGIQLAFNHNGGSIYNNRISDIKQRNTVGYGCNGMNFGAATTASNITFYNNFIYDVAAVGYDDVTVGDNGYGIIFTAGGGYKVYHNTVSLATDQAASAGHSFAVNVTTGVTTVGSIDLRNNILSNTQTLGDRQAIYVAANSNVFSNINYNDYFSTGTNLGHANGANYSTLSALAAALGGNANSLNVSPLFVSATDLHLQPVAANAGLDNKGTPVAITTDIDGDTRSNSTPDMGADEFTVPSSCTAPSITLNPTAQGTCPGGSVSFLVGASGTAPLSYQWKKDGAPIAGATTNGLDIANVTAANAGNYYVVVSNACGVDSSNSRDLIVYSRPVSNFTNSAPGCAPAAIHFTATSTIGQGAIGSYFYEFGDGQSAQVPNPDHTFATAGTYNVKLVTTSMENCADTVTKTLTIGCTTAVSNLQAGISEASLLPTAVRDNATIRVSANRSMTINWTLVDGGGRIVRRFTQAVANGNGTLRIALNDLAPGTYQLLGYSDKGKATTLRFVKL